MSGGNPGSGINILSQGTNRYIQSGFLFIGKLNISLSAPNSEALTDIIFHIFHRNSIQPGYL